MSPESDFLFGFLLGAAAFATLYIVFEVLP